MRKLVYSYALSALFCLAFAAQGAKTPLQFLIWGTATLGLCGLVLWQNLGSLSITAYKKEIALFLCIVAASNFFPRSLCRVSLKLAKCWFYFYSGLRSNRIHYYLATKIIFIRRWVG